MASEPGIGIIAGEAERRSIYPEPADLTRVLPTLDDRYPHFIFLSSIVFLSTASRDGRFNVMPRRVAPVFPSLMRCKRTLLPDRPGNTRIDNSRIGRAFQACNAANCQPAGSIPTLAEILSRPDQTRWRQSALLTQSDNESLQ